MVPTSGRGANRLNRRKRRPWGSEGTGAGKGIGGTPAVSGVGGGIPKNIGEVNNMKWIRVHIKGHGSYHNLPENPEGSEGLRRRSTWEWAGAEAGGGERTLG